MPIGHLIAQIFPIKKNNSRVDHEEFGKLLRMILA